MTESRELREGVRVGEVLRNAVVFNFENWSGRVLEADSLPGEVERLFALLEERRVDCLLVGGVALLRYVPGRNTEDLDLIVALTGLEALPELETIGRDMDFVRGKFGSLSVDLLLTRNPLFNKVKSEYATTGRFSGHEIPCATVEGLLVLKMYALPSLYRQGDFARVGLYENDVATLVQAYQPPLEPLLAELAGHLGATDLAAVHDIVAEIQRRIERFRRESGANG